MIDAHGWIQLWDSAADPDAHDVAAAVAELDAAARPLRSSAVHLRFDAVGGQHYLGVHLQANHRNPEHDAVEAFLARVGERLPASFGTIHWRDDEGPTPNHYRVLVMTRGALVEHADALLSPCRPVIED